MVVEQYMYDAYKRNEERVNQLHRALDAGMATEAFVRIIFDWPAPVVEEEKPEPVAIPTKTIAPPPPKPLTSKKAEMMAKVKKLHLEGLNGKQNGHFQADSLQASDLDELNEVIP